MNISDIHFDQDSQTLTICGVTYSAGYFEGMGMSPVGTWIRINGRNMHGVVTVFSVNGSMAKTFDVIAGLK